MRTFAILLTGAATLIAQSHAAGGDICWTYIEQDEIWPAFFPTCGGSKQSPIDIRPKKADGKKFDPIVLSAKYFSSLKGKYFNNGHTVEFNVGMTETSGKIPSFSGGPVGKDVYQFLQFHFHWGSNNKKGSEHTLDGKSFPGEVHLVHWNTKYDNVGKALGKEDGLSVLGFFIDIDKNADKDSKLAAFGEHAHDIHLIGQEVEVATILSSIIEKGIEHGIYTTYSGSLTTPGCNEIVTWVNFLQPITVREDFFKSLRTLKDNIGMPMVDNYRTVQDLNKRKVQIYE